ncbi:MAG: DUF4097 family beta strand repeat-containing protein [Bryobacteraceae bacterium]
MRPRSLIGPLLLIAFGAVLLAHTLNPQWPLLEILARSWPFVLMAWGVLRLIEILAWRLRRLPLPAAGMSAGEWTAVVLICVLGSGLHTAYRYRPWERISVIAEKRFELFGRPFDFPIAEQLVPAPAAPHLVIENLRGNFRITGADVREIRASGRKTVRALESSEATDADRRTPLEIAAAGDKDRLVIRTNLDRVPSDFRISVDLDIAVPRSTVVEVRGREGDLEATSLQSVSFTADNGSVRATKIAGPVRVNLGRAALIRLEQIAGTAEIVARRGRDLDLEAIRGAVSVEGFYSGDLRFADIAGPLRLQNTQFTLRVPRIAGHVHLDLGELTAVRLEGPVYFSSARPCDVELDEFSSGAEISLDRGDIRLRPTATLGPIQARTRGGDIELLLPESATVQLHARTARGNVFNQFGPVLREVDEAAHGATLSGGDSGPRVQLETMRGSITVRKDSGAPLSSGKERERATVEIETDQGKLRIQRH